MKKIAAFLALTLPFLFSLQSHAIQVWVDVDNSHSSTTLSARLTPDGSDSDTLTYSGDMLLDLTLNEAGDKVVSFTIEDGRSSFSNYFLNVNSDVVFQGNSFDVTYIYRSSSLGGFYATIDGPATVDPNTNVVDNAQIVRVIDRGSVTITSRVDGLSEDQVFDYDDELGAQDLTGTNTLELIETGVRNGQTIYQVLMKIHGLEFVSDTPIEGSNSRIIFDEEGLVHYVGEIAVTRPVPYITGELTQRHGVGSPFQYTITADNTPTSFAFNNAPSGMSINPSTGEITWQTPVAGTYDIELTTTNAIGTDTQTLQLTIGNPPLLVSNPYSDPFTLLVLESYTLDDVTFANADSYSLENAPPTMFHIRDTELRWTPRDPGTYSAELVAENEFGTTTATLNFSVIDEPSISNGLEISIGVQETLNHTITTTHPVSNFSFPADASGSHYSAASLSSDGTLQFTPSASGYFTFQIEFEVAEQTLTEDLVVRVIAPIERWAISEYGENINVVRTLLSEDAFGITPLERYAYNLPAHGPLTQLQEGGNSGLPRIKFDREKQKLFCTFIRRRNAGLSNIRYVVEFTDQLNSEEWDNVPPSLVTSIDESLERVHVDDSSNQGASPKRFARVRVILD